MKLFWNYIMVVVIQPCKYSKYDKYPCVIHFKKVNFMAPEPKKEKRTTAMTEILVYPPLIEIHTNTVHLLSFSNLNADSGCITGDLVKWASRDK